MNIFGKRSDLPFYTQERSRVVSFTHEQNIICSQTQLDNIAHEQIIICRELFPGHVVGFGQWKEEKFASNDKGHYCCYYLLLGTLWITYELPITLLFLKLKIHSSSFFFKQLLKEEIAVMKDKLEHHPDVTRFAMENLELRGNWDNLLRVLSVPFRQHRVLSYDSNKIFTCIGNWD